MTRRLWLGAILVWALLTMPALACADDLGIPSVNTSGWPTVRVGLTLPASAKGAEPTAVRVWENGVEIQGPRIKSLSAERQAVDVVLLIDVSGSMKGAPIADAQAAARRFASTMGPRDRIAVVAFGPRATVIGGLTGDQFAVQSNLAKLNADGETALYDGLVTSAEMLSRDASGRRAICKRGSCWSSWSWRGTHLLWFQC